jgi:hypothetical protein
MRTLPAATSESWERAVVPEAYRISPVVYEESPVPPYCAPIAVPFQVDPDPIVLLVRLSAPAKVASVPVVGRVTLVVAVAVRVRL